MRNLFLIFSLVLCVSLSALAQNDVTLSSNRFDDMNARNYLRPSLTKIYLLNCDQAREGAIKFDQEEDLRFDVNNVNPRSFIIGSFGDKKEMRDSIIQANINKIINDYKLGNQIMKNWFPNFTDGAYTTEMLLKRGEFAATDQDVMKMKASARQSLLFELGERLIDRSYVMFVAVDAQSRQTDNGIKWSYDYYPYIYKLNFDEQVRTDFYNNYFSQENGIDLANFPVNFVYTPNKSCDDLYDVYSRCRSVSDFQVKAPVAEVHPVRAKIGKKEGLHIDDRYLVLENREREDGSEYVHKVSVVRCKHVGDNNKAATGETEDLSSFYTIKGGRARQGLHYLAEYRDMGMAFAVTPNIAEMGFQLNYSMARAFKVPGLSLFLRGGMMFDEDFKPMKIMTVNEENNKVELKSTLLAKVALGLEKEFNVAHHFTLTPSVGGGVVLPLGGKHKLTGRKVDNNNQITWQYDESSKYSDLIDTYFVDASLKLGFYINYHVLLYAEGGYSYYFKGDNFKFGQEAYALDKKKNDIVDPQKIRAGIGLKFYW